MVGLGDRSVSWGGNGGPQVDCFDERESPGMKRELKEKKYIHRCHRWMSAGGWWRGTRIIRTLFINSGAHQAEASFGIIRKLKKIILV